MLYDLYNNAISQDVSQINLDFKMWTVLILPYILIILFCPELQDCDVSSSIFCLFESSTSGEFCTYVTRGLLNLQFMNTNII